MSEFECLYRLVLLLIIFVFIYIYMYIYKCKDVVLNLIKNRK